MSVNTLTFLGGVLGTQELPCVGELTFCSLLMLCYVLQEYLRATWQRLGVGHDGYLSLEELATVCHAIGMDKVANEVRLTSYSKCVY